MSTYANTMRLLQIEKRTAREVAASSGLSYHWLCKLKQGQIDSPGITMIEKLYADLRKHAAPPTKPGRLGLMRKALRAFVHACELDPEANPGEIVDQAIVSDPILADIDLAAHYLREISTYRSKAA